MKRFILLSIIYFCFAHVAAASETLFKNIFQYAELSNAAYGNLQDIQSALQTQGFKLDQAKALSGYEIAYFIASNPQTQQQVISIRGSSNMNNAILDMSVQLVAEPHLSIRLHEGFAAAADAIYADIKPYLNSQYRINLTGHSLGGAVAAILAMHLSVDHYSVGQVITFAQPKVTDMKGSKRYAHLNILRVTAAKDAVPLMPPFSFTNMSLSEIYWHVGDELLLYSGAQYSRLSAHQSLLRAADIVMQMPDEKNIQAHSMNHYMVLIQAKLRRAIYTPYKSMANPLNWIF